MGSIKTQALFPLTLNRIFELDQTFKSVFQKLISRRRRKIRVRNRGEQLVRIACIVPSFVPFVFVLSLFHPADPVHNLLKDVFEIKVEPTLFIFCFAIVLFWGVFLIIQIFINFIIVFALYIYLTGFWLTAIMPKSVQIYNFKSNVYHVKTLNQDIVHQEVLIWVHRCLHCVNALVHELVGKPCVTFHSTGILIAVVASSFAIIRFYNGMFDGTAMGLSLFLVLLGVSVLLTTLYSFECHFLGQLEDISKTYKSKILKVSKRQSVLYKTAKSFQLLRLKSGGTFFNVNRSTFLEWCDQIISNLVNALVTFK